jgi:flagellar biosynthetic protein FlhB
MASNKTEKPTHHRLQKARDGGQIPSSRDLVVSLQLAIAVFAGASIGEKMFESLRSTMVMLFGRAFSGQDLSIDEMRSLFNIGLAHTLEALLGGAALIVLIVLMVHLTMSGFHFSLNKLMPDFSRLNPAPRIKGMPRQNLFSALKAVALLPLIAYLLYEEIFPHLTEIANLAVMGLGESMAQVGHMMKSLLTRLIFVLLVVGVVDYVRQRKNFVRDLRMTKQEVKDEMKEMGGNPQLKMRIRRLQRDFMRRKMISAVPQATAVIVNPTHYAVALHYDMNAKAVPTVVAKGKNHLALQIRKKAMEHGIPITENKPLAQALYKAVEVNQEIPSHLYRAVAEVLAYIYRTVNQRA